MNLIGAIGICYDIVGVVYLGMALVAATNSRLKSQSETRWGANSEVLRGLIQQRTDARIGLPILFLGFVGQLLGAVSIQVSSNVISWLAVMLLVVALLAGGGRGWLAERTFKGLFAELAAETA
jgi:hypothetical protein